MKKLIIDFDSTLVKVEALDELAERALVEHRDRDALVTEIKKITELGMNGEISFPESLSRRIKLIQTTREVVAEVADCIKEKISYSVLNNLDFFKENKDNIFIISGGFKDLIFPTAEILGIHPANILANDFIFDNEGNLIGVDNDNLMAQENGKVNQLKILNLEGELIMVGDGWTDYQTKEFGVVDKFIAYTENVSRETVVKKADVVAKDFKEVIEFVTSY
ncbi:MAG: phosphoserine phosphatase / D-3-phosphoglycerate dehydrogenase [Candidatus Moranbacteria bacterium GW2011_GWE2_35_164]|nr:MAG: phosphoserine phosphatase / D-3-phosphoglycerate dehydrogenase [Candidatus Moranbacteria bacterium GW2011_GWE2_35_164]